MRRLLSISLVTALLAIPLSPVWAVAACSHASAQPACHRMSMHMDHPGHQEHHCDGMSPSEESDATDETAVRAASSENCPMNCCVQGQTHSAGSTVATSLLPPLAATDKELSFVPVKFSSVGFSSHTDRGPPAAPFFA